LPDGVISFLPGDGPVQGAAALDSEHLAGIHFTGSTKTFRSLWRGVSDRLDRYRAFPRIVGETGGKDFVLAHPTADFDALAVAILRGGFEYQGQKCSAVSRVYVPRSMWGRLKERLASDIRGIKVGDVRDFSNFMGAVIDARSFEKITGYIALANETATVVAGGTSDPSHGWFVSPTLVEVSDPKHRLMQEEIFGPVVTVYVYDDPKFDEVLELVDTTSPYALTGAIFARDRDVIVRVSERLRFSAGNFYINDKPTGAVVGQQPFGSARASGTDDKAGSLWNLARWTAPRAIKETFAPPVDYRYPFMGS
jgi:1-pyrroline-5-carboxylate dehydrogenase